MVVVKNSLMFVAALALWTPADVAGRDAPRVPNWDTTLAVQTADLPASQARVDELFALLRSRELSRLNAQLDSIISGASLSEPVRDAVLFHFAVGLADFDDVDEEILQRLRAVEPRVLVPHEERASVGVPLFNIAGAAEGVYQLGLRREARSRALEALHAPPDDWIDAYLVASNAQRLGFAEALDGAGHQALEGVLGAALRQLPSHPQLTPVAGKAALLLGDAAALGQVLRHGGGSDVARILEAAGLTLPADESLTLLVDAVAGAPAANAALAIARLYPGLADRPEATGLLFDTLSNDALGAAAALALAGSSDAGIRARLQQAAEGEGAAAARARSALGSDARRAEHRP